MLKIAGKIYGYANVLLLAWVVISWAEIAMFNLNPGHSYANWNAFVLMVKWFC